MEVLYTTSCPIHHIVAQTKKRQNKMTGGQSKHINDQCRESEERSGIGLYLAGTFKQASS
jgi:hypothetical protein